MPRISNFEHLKPEVVAAFEHGLQLKDVYKKFSEIPRTTIREWFKPFRQDSANISPDAVNQAGQGATNPDPPAQRPTLIVVGGAESVDEDSLPDIRWVKRQLRNIVKIERNNAIRIQAYNTYLRAVQLELSMPPQPVKINFDELSDQELERLAAGETVENMVS